MAERPIVLPDMFNGEGSWTEWKYNFLNIAQVNEWDDNSKIQWLLVHLVGRAQGTICSISKDSSFAAVIKAVIKALDERVEPSSRRV